MEPSDAMIAQRRAGAAPAVRAAAEQLPFESSSFDAAMAVMTLHHWRDREAGLAELRRVARDRVVDPHLGPRPVRRVLAAGRLPAGGQRARLHAVPAAGRDRRAAGRAHRHPRGGDPTRLQDGFLEAYWARPEAFLDPAVRAGTSALAQLPAAILDPALERLRGDLESGEWHRRHGHLLELDELDLGYRLLVTELG